MIKKKISVSIMALTVSLPLLGPAVAGTSSYIGEVTIMASNFCPRGTAEMAGQLLSIAQNNALFSILGTTYGGDGRKTFGLPDMRGRVSIGDGSGPGLSPARLGAKIGAESVTLIVQNLAVGTEKIYQASDSNDAAIAASSIDVLTPGKYQPSPIDTRSPGLVLTYCINIQGIYPARN